jgi:hypothetical protein
LRLKSENAALREALQAQKRATESSRDESAHIQHVQNHTHTMHTHTSTWMDSISVLSTWFGNRRSPKDAQHSAVVLCV